MERLARLTLLLSILVSCTPSGKSQFDAWSSDYASRPARFGQAVTALWVARYTEESGSRHFFRSSAWGEVPEKLVPDGQGGFTSAVPLLVQSEGSDGPRADRFDSILVQVLPSADGYTLAPNKDLPGEVVGWTDGDRRTVHFRGRVLGPGPDRILWEFQGRY